MRADNYPPINVLSVFKGFEKKELRYVVTPYRFSNQQGDTYHISEIRHFHRDRQGHGIQFHYVVNTKEGILFRILFDTNTFTWRLIEKVIAGEIKDTNQQQ